MARSAARTVRVRVMAAQISDSVMAGRTAEHVEVGVEDGLPGSRAGVGDEAVVGVARGLRDLVGQRHEVAEARRVGGRRRGGVLVVVERHDEHVERRLRVEVA